MRRISSVGSPSCTFVAKGFPDLTHSQHNPEARPPADHRVISFGGLRERIALDHWTNAPEGAELERILRVFCRARGSAANGFAAGDQLQRSHSQRFHSRTDDHQRPSGPEPVHQRRHRLRIWRRGENHLRATQLLKRLRRRAGAGIKLGMRPQLCRQSLLVSSASDRDGAKPHLARVLDSKMSQPTDALDGD